MHPVQKVLPTHLQKQKEEKRKITMLSIYDYARAIVPTLQAVHNAGVPVIGHIGLTPQNAAQLGGLKVQGGDAVGGMRLLEEALALEAAGAFAVILECVPREVARVITTRLRVPT